MVSSLGTVMTVSRRVGLITSALVITLLPACASGADGDRSASASTRASASGSVSASGSGSAAGSSSASASASASTSTSARGRYALFFGDSNFVGGGCTPDAQQDMARIAGDLLGYRSVIRGGGGTGFATGNPQYGLKSFTGQVRDGQLDMSPAPSLVVIEGGSNDTADLLGKAARNAKRVIRAAQSRYPDALVVLMGPIDVRAGHGDVIPRLVPMLRQSAATVGVPFLDAYDWLPWRTQSGLVCSDYDHATPAGQQILGHTLATRLSAVGA